MWASAPGDRRRREMRQPVGEVLVDLVVDVPHAARGAQSVDGAQVGLGIDGAAGVVRRDRHHGTRARRDGRGNRVDLELIPRVGGHHDGPAGCHHHGHLVVEVIRRLQDHLVAGIGHGQHRVHEREVAAGRDDHARARQVEMVLRGELAGERLHQRRQALDRPVPMRGGLGQKPRHRRQRLLRRPVADHPLPQRDRPGRLTNPLTENRNDGRLDGARCGETWLNSTCASCTCTVLRAVPRAWCLVPRAMCFGAWCLVLGFVGCDWCLVPRHPALIATTAHRTSTRAQSTGHNARGTRNHAQGTALSTVHRARSTIRAAQMSPRLGPSAPRSRQNASHSSPPTRRRAAPARTRSRCRD